MIVGSGSGYRVVELVLLLFIHGLGFHRSLTVTKAFVADVLIATLARQVF